MLTPTQSKHKVLEEPSESGNIWSQNAQVLVRVGTFFILIPSSTQCSMTLQHSGIAGTHRLIHTDFHTATVSSPKRILSISLYRCRLDRWNSKVAASAISSVSGLSRSNARTHHRLKQSKHTHADTACIQIRSDQKSRHRAPAETQSFSRSTV